MLKSRNSPQDLRGIEEFRSIHHCLQKVSDHEEVDESDLSEQLQNGDDGALAEYEGSADQSHHPPDCEDHSGERTSG